MFRFTIRDLLWLMAGSFGAWLATGWYYMKGIDGVELHPDADFMGAVCLFCPLVGIFVALIARRFATASNT